MPDVAQLNAKLIKALMARGVDARGVLPGEGALLSDALIEAGRVSGEMVNQALEEVTGCRSVDPTMVSFAPEFLAHATSLVSRGVAVEEKVFLIRHEGNFAHLVMSNPEDLECIKRMEYITGSQIEPYGCYSKGILDAIAEHYPESERELPELQDVHLLLPKAEKAVNTMRASMADESELVNNADVIKLLRCILNDLVKRGSSDLHFEPQETYFKVRYRSDGVMVTAWKLPLSLRGPLTDRLKQMSGLDPQLTHKPQDGAIAYHIIEGREIDVRVSVLPSLYGEKVVLRVLDKGKDRMTLKDLGLEDRDAVLLDKAIQRPNGLLLVTGPTGSGKSTTLYAALQDLNSDQVNIVTAEDPVEYKLDGLTQVSCSESAGLTFNDVIRSFMRQDPDIIMVGEIRDAETADFAVKASMTGHLVLSTLHTNDAAGAVNRLVNMGVPPFLVSSAQLTVVAQRLMRTICPDCKQVVESPAESARIPELAELPEPPVFYEGAGCDRCNGTGYSGRTGVYEILPVSDRMEKMILAQETAGALKRVAVEEGMRTLRQAALEKLRQGVTTVEEVVRVTMDA